MDPERKRLIKNVLPALLIAVVSIILTICIYFDAMEGQYPTWLGMSIAASIYTLIALVIHRTRSNKVAPEPSGRKIALSRI